MFHVMIRLGEIPMIVTSRVSTLIWAYLIDVGDFSLIYPFLVRLFLIEHVSCSHRVMAVFDETCFTGLCFDGLCLMGCAV